MTLHEIFCCSKTACDWDNTRSSAFATLTKTLQLDSQSLDSQSPSGCYDEIQKLLLIELKYLTKTTIGKNKQYIFFRKVWEDFEEK